MSQQKYFNTIMEFVYEAGKIALKYFENSHSTLKADQSVVTVADKKISELARKKLVKFLSKKDHILIDEEDPKVAGYLDKRILQKATYLWSIDPIDGTRNYANQIPSFGISVGLLKNLQPWMGVVYFPLLQELFYHDGHRAYFVKGAHTKHEKKKIIKPIHIEVNSKTYFLATDTFFKNFDWDHQDCRVMIQSCAAIELCWPSVGRGCGSLIKSSLWDFAGSWPIIRAADLDLRSLRTGQKLSCVDLKHFNLALPWKLNDFYIISDQKNYSVIRKKIQAK